jgi:hypothetical protein
MSLSVIVPPAHKGAAPVTGPTSPILRIRLLPKSLKYILPDASQKIALGSLIIADNGEPPSPLKPAVPVPAMVDIIPDVLIFLIRLVASVK